MALFSDYLVRGCANLGRLPTIVDVFNQVRFSLRVLIIPVCGIEEIAGVIANPLVNLLDLLGMFYVLDRLGRLRARGDDQDVQADIF